MDEQKVELKVNGAATGGAAARPPAPERHRSYAQVLQVVSVMALAGCLLVGGLELGMPAAGLLVALLASVSVVAFLAAVDRAVKARRDEDERAGTVMYRVTPARISTLKAERVPPDVREALAKLVGDEPMTEEGFLTRLALDPDIDLGWERTREFKDRILKYTRVEQAPPPSSPASADAQPPAPTAQALG